MYYDTITRLFEKQFSTKSPPIVFCVGIYRYIWLKKKLSPYRVVAVLELLMCVQGMAEGVTKMDVNNTKCRTNTVVTVRRKCTHK